MSGERHRRRQEASGAGCVGIARRTYSFLWLSGYARIDLRLDPAGELYVLEANPNQQIAKSEDFADSAERAGLSCEALLQRILGLSLRRHLLSSLPIAPSRCPVGSASDQSCPV